MKVAFFNYLMLEYGGGVAKYYIEISTGLRERFSDLDIDIITLDKNTINVILFIYSIYFFGRQDRNLLNKENRKTILNQLGVVKYYNVSLINLREKLQEYDLIYSTNNLLEVLLLKYLIGYKQLPPIAYGFHIPSSYQLTDSIQSKLHNFLYDSPFYKKAIKDAWRLHVINNFDLGRYSKLISKDNVFRIYNPFVFDNFANKADKFKYEFSWNRGAINLLWVGRLTEQKGVDDLINLVGLVNNSPERKKVVWNIVGEGELRRLVQELARQWSNVNYHGYVQNQYMPSIIANNDIFISTSKWESFPYNILEAQTLGLPVISYNIYGCNDIVDNGKNGYLVNNVNEFKNKIVNFRKNKKRNIFIKKYIRGKFSEENIYKEIHNFFVS